MHSSSRTRRPTRPLLLLLLAALLFSAAAPACIPEDPGGIPYATSKDPNSAPDDRPSIVGRVLDGATGEPVKGALMTSTPTSEAVLTRDDGAYLLSVNLKPGNNRVKATAVGYEPATVSVYVDGSKATAADILLYRPGQRPAVTITPSVLIFEPDRHRLTAQVHNISPDEAAWTFEGLPPWLLMTPRQGRLRPGQRVQVTAQLDTSVDLQATINPGALAEVLASAKVRTEGAGAVSFASIVRLARADSIGGVWITPERGDLEEDEPLELQPGEEQQLELRIDVEGRPLVGTAVHLQLLTEGGDTTLLAAQTTDADGVARWSFTPTGEGELRAVARLSAFPDVELPSRHFFIGDDAQQGGVASARDSTLEVDPARAPVGDRILVRVRVRDAIGTPLAGVAVELDADDTLDITQPSVTDAEGWAEGSISSDAPLQTRVGARLDPSGLDLPLTERVAVEFYDPADPTAEIILDPIGGDGIVQGIADGTTEACFTFTLQDSDGAPRVNTRVNVTSTPAGYVAEVTTDDQGRAQVCPTSDTPGDITYILAVDDTTGEVVVRYVDPEAPPRTPAWTWTWAADPDGLEADRDPATFGRACLVLSDANANTPLVGQAITFVATAADPGGPDLQPDDSATDPAGSLCVNLDSHTPGPKTLRATFTLDGVAHTTEPLRARFALPAPEVLIDTQPETRGCGDITYALRHPLGLPVDLRVERRPREGAPWEPLTVAPTASFEHEGLLQLGTDSSPEGFPHVLRWNSLADLPGQHLPGAELRLQACAEDVCSDPVQVAAPVGNHTRFALGQTLPLLNTPGEQVLQLLDATRGDFDGNGLRDIAVLARVQLVNGQQRWRLIFLNQTTPGTFATSDVTVAPGATRITSADFDRDGRDDLAFIEGEYAAPLHILLAAADFLVDTPIDQGFNSANEFVHALVAGDVNNDGAPDLVTITQQRGLYLRGRGTGAFETPVNTGSIQNADARFNEAQLVDLNADGRLDLLTFFRDSTLASYALGGNTTNGSFPTISNGGYRIDGLLTNTGALTPVDLDGDNRPELIGSSPLGIQVLRSIPQSNGSLVWAPAGSVAHNLTGSVTVRGGVVDANVDGRPDLLVFGRADANQDGIQIVTGEADALSVIAEPTQPLASRGDLPPILEDFNGDGHPDLVFFGLQTNGLQSVVQVFPGERPTSCAANIDAPRSALVDTLPDRLFAVDLDGDRTPDLAAAEGGTLRLHRGLGDGTLELDAWPPITTALTDITEARAQDFDGDGGADLLITGAAAAGGRWQVHPNATAAFPSAPRGADSPAALRRVALGDLNQGGTDDLLATYADGAVAWLRGEDSAFSGPTPLSLTGVADARLLDANGDGFLDIAAALQGGGLRILPGLGGGAFGPAQERDLPAGALLAVADLNGDGFDDLLALEPSAAQLHVHPGGDTQGDTLSTDLELSGLDLSDARLSLVRDREAGAWSLRITTPDALIEAPSLGDGTFGAATVWDAPVGGIYALADFDGDGRTQLATAVDLSTGPRLVIDVASGDAPTFTPDALDTTAPVDELLVADLDYSGSPDALLLTHNPGALTIARDIGSGAAALDAPLANPANVELEDVVAAYLNLDLRLDLLVLDRTNNAGVLLLGDNPGTFSATSTWSPPSASPLEGLLPVDYNNNSLPDVVGVDASGNLWASGLNRFGFNGTESDLGGSPLTGALQIAFARLDDNGYPDPILASSVTRAVAFGMNGDSGITDFTATAPTLEQARRMRLANLSGDPALEVIVLGEDGQLHAAEPGLDAGSCTAAGAGSAPCLVDVATLTTQADVLGFDLFDLNRDGRQDVIASTADGTTVVFLSGATFSDLGATSYAYLPRAAGPLVVTHLDRDGRPEALLVDADGARLLTVPAR